MGTTVRLEARVFTTSLLDVLLLDVLVFAFDAFTRSAGRNLVAVAIFCFGIVFTSSAVLTTSIVRIFCIITIPSAG
jgi:hypothetical protein